VSNESGSTDGGQVPGSDEASHDALGDTQLGRSLKELIKEIGKEKEALKRALDPSQAAESKQQDAEEDFDPSLTRFDQALELAATATREPGANGSDTGSQPESQTDAAAPAPADAPTRAADDPAESPGAAEISQAMTGMEEVLRRFAEAERKRAEKQLAAWKLQLKKATMIVIKKQVDNARARWMENQTFNEAKVAEHYQRLKALADKVAKQKAQIQKAKQELEKKLEVADRLHNEFDEIRTVLDGQIGAIDALDEDGGPSEPKS
jgi:hypothetical protein